MSCEKTSGRLNGNSNDVSGLRYARRARCDFDDVKTKNIYIKNADLED